MYKRIRARLWRAFGLCLCGALTALNYAAPMRYVRALPDTIRVNGAGESSVLTSCETRYLYSDRTSIPVSGSTDERLHRDVSKVTYRLFGVIPVKTVSVVRGETVYVAPGGESVGIMIRTQGVLVVGLGAVDTASGALSPGSAAGLRAGDVILRANGESIKNANHLSSICAASDGSLRLEIERDTGVFETDVACVQDERDRAYRLGLWVRDSTAGVGTLSFYDVETGWFAALGHPVSDVDTQSLLRVREGRILNSEIVGIKRGEQGSPGELTGVFSTSDAPIGEILLNNAFGIFGRMSLPHTSERFGEVEMAFGCEARTGEAELLATVSNEGVQAFSCEIIRVNTQSSASGKGMIVEITDPVLLEETGGIVQGMSGCPVLQDGRLIGVVTHVFVNDPTRGYCVYAEWMREQILSAAGDAA